MTRLHRMYDEQGQSPWLDNLTRPYLRDGTLARYVGQRYPAVSPPTRPSSPGPSKAPMPTTASSAGSSPKDARLRRGLLEAGDRRHHRHAGAAPADLRRERRDPTGSCLSKWPPSWATTPTGPSAAPASPPPADRPAQRVGQDPGAAEGTPADRGDDRRGAQHQHHVDLLAGTLRRGDRGIPVRPRDVRRYGRQPQLGAQRGVVLREPGGHRGRPPARRHRHRPGPPLAEQGGSRTRSARLPPFLRVRRPAVGPPCRRGAHVQRPLWASTSTKNPALPDTFYVDNLIGPDTGSTLARRHHHAAFEDHGTVAKTIDADFEGAARLMGRLATVGIDMDDVGATLEDEGLASFHDSFAHVLEGYRYEGPPALAPLTTGWTGWALFGPSSRLPRSSGMPSPGPVGQEGLASGRASGGPLRL